jgi:hypothetical protein
MLGAAATALLQNARNKERSMRDGVIMRTISVLACDTLDASTEDRLGLLKDMFLPAAEALKEVRLLFCI